jgi:hypothetical protein
LVEVEEFISSNEAVLIGVGANLKTCAALAGANFKAGAIFGEGVRTLLVNKGDRN